MDMPDTLTDDGAGAVVDDVPMLPMLPTEPPAPAPVLPPRSPAEVISNVTGNGTADVTTEVPVSPVPAWFSPSLTRTNRAAANAPYGVMPGKPRAGEPSPATLQAAEQRRRTKKRRRIRRLGLLVVAIAVVAIAGPPTVRWIASGFDKAGSTGTESSPSGTD